MLQGVGITGVPGFIGWNAGSANPARGGTAREAPSPPDPAPHDCYFLYRGGMEFLALPIRPAGGSESTCARGVMLEGVGIIGVTGFIG